MKLLTVGDSFTYGEELADRMVAWPYLLGKMLEGEVTNLGRPSKSNTYITRQTIEHAQNYDLIVIAWSHFARMEFADDHGTYELWPGCAGNLFRNEVEYRKNLLDYINRYHSDQYLYTQQLLNIILLQNYLKQNNKKYLMLTSFNQNYGSLNTSNLRLSCQDLLKQIDRTYYPGWPDNSMMEWTYRTPQGPNGHFLDEGHKIVADKIYEYIRNFGWVS